MCVCVCVCVCVKNKVYPYQPLFSQHKGIKCGFNTFICIAAESCFIISAYMIQDIFQELINLTFMLEKKKQVVTIQNRSKHYSDLLNE